MAIVPDRQSLFRNEFHNGLRRTAARQNMTLDIRDYGENDATLLQAILQKAVDTPTEGQPRTYVVWPMAGTAWLALLRELHQRHNATIIQAVGSPHATAWDDFLTAFVGVDFAQTGIDQGQLMMRALQQQQSFQQASVLSTSRKKKVLVLGFPQGYANNQFILSALNATLEEANIELAAFIPNAWGIQPAYLNTLHYFRQQEAAKAFPSTYTTAPPPPPPQVTPPPTTTTPPPPQPPPQPVLYPPPQLLPAVPMYFVAPSFCCQECRVWTQHRRGRPPHNQLCHKRSQQLVVGYGYFGGG